MDNRNVRFFWVGEESEIFVAASIRQLASDNGRAGTGIDRWEDHADRGVLLFDEEGEMIEWGELDAIATRMTLRKRGDDDRPLETLRGNLYDLYAWTDGRFNLPVMFCTQYG